MLTFAYKARDAHGQAVAGTIDARNQPDALRLLQRDGKTVTDIKVGPRGIDAEEVRLRHAASYVRREDVISLAVQLSVMLETGVPLNEALDAFLKQSRSSHLRAVMEVVADRLRGGVPFSVAMSEFPRAFPNLMISLMRASEASGKMGSMLARIADYLGKERRTSRQVRGTLTYPFIMVLLAASVTLFLVTWVLPRFARIYESRAAALPAPTKVLLATSNLILDHWQAIISGLLALAIGLISIRLFAWGQRLADGIKLRAPVLGPIFKQFYLTRAARTLATLLASGVNLLDAVRICRGVTSNVYWQDLWGQLEAAMTSGRTISEVLAVSPLIPPSVAQMITAGERTGRLPEVLERVAASSDSDLEEAIKAATQLIEPAMIIFMGVTIGGISIALLLPIFNVANVIAK